MEYGDLGRRSPLIRRYSLAAFGPVWLVALLTTGALLPAQSSTMIVDPVPGPIVSSINARVTSGGLRIRSLPGQIGEVISKLAKDDQLQVESKTSWTDTIDGITAPWFEVSKGWSAGWCFGGYLFIKDAGKVPTSSVGRTQSTLLHSYFGGADGKDIGPLPYQNMKIFGIETPYKIPSVNGFGSAYDDMNQMVFLEVALVPQETVLVRVSDPRGNRYTADLGEKGDARFERIEANEQGFKYAKPVIAFQFRAPANAFGGEWLFEVLPDKKESLKNRFRISVGIAAATLSQTIRPSPFNYPGSVAAKEGDVLYLFGSDATPNTKVKIAFYQITSQQNEDLSFKLKPVVAGELISDTLGRYRTTLHIGSDMPTGQYKFGFGESKITLDLFDIYLAVQ